VLSCRRRAVEDIAGWQPAPLDGDGSPIRHVRVPAPVMVTRGPRAGPRSALFPRRPAGRAQIVLLTKPLPRQPDPIEGIRVVGLIPIAPLRPGVRSREPACSPWLLPRCRRRRPGSAPRRAGGIECGHCYPPLCSEAALNGVARTPQTELLKILHCRPTVSPIWP